MKSINMILVATVTLTLLICAYSQTQQSRSDSSQTNSNDQSTKEVIAKAKGRKLLAKRLPDWVEGLELKDGTLRVKPGYDVVSQPNGSFALARANNGGATATTVDCRCNANFGRCVITRTDNYISCKEETSCKNEGCILSTSSLSGARRGIIMY